MKQKAFEKFGAAGHGSMGDKGGHVHYVKGFVVQGDQGAAEVTGKVVIVLACF